MAPNRDQPNTRSIATSPSYVYLSNPPPLSGWPCEGVLDEDELIDKTVVVDLAMERVRVRTGHASIGRH